MDGAGLKPWVIKQFIKEQQHRYKFKSALRNMHSLKWAELAASICCTVATASLLYS